LELLIRRPDWLFVLVLTADRAFAESALRLWVLLRTRSRPVSALRTVSTGFEALPFRNLGTARDVTVGFDIRTYPLRAAPLSLGVLCTTAGWGLFNFDRTARLSGSALKLFEVGLTVNLSCTSVPRSQGLSTRR